MSRRTSLATGGIVAALVAIFVLVNPLVPAFAQSDAMLLANDPAPLVANTRAGRRSFTIEVADVAEERQRGLSGMPEELRQVLTKQDLRNLVEFLSRLK